eukprot:TRINITY_DN14263_c0_g1_i1.p1 TRINITY_DN14263_c0_g1~~TRINITY_DN14263_c0_g1_i1.p1  ORF type:complete len:247 (-),score=45.62 TRINITY_DN14263_c0_g1_i1:7-747(-)
MEASRERVFLDINIGSASDHQQQVEAHERAKAFLKEFGESYGLGTDISALDKPAQDTLVELYNADPSYVSKGAPRAEVPTSLHAGRVVIELYREASPEAVENFVCLCTGEKGKSKTGSNKMLHYKDTRFHRIVKGFVMQGGDFTRGDGSGGESIWGRKFKDDRGGLKLTHDHVGTVSMANSGKNANTSQFFITFTDKNPKLDGKHVVFGRVVAGLDVIERVHQEAATATGVPAVDVVIADCGKSIN